jgi:IS1 family transposase/transposase-like protein
LYNTTKQIKRNKIIMKCPQCSSKQIIKNGSVRKKQKYECKNCGRQFVEHPLNVTISEEKWDLVDNLLLEKIPLAGIARVVGISERSLQSYVNKKYDSIPKHINATLKKPGRLTIQCDEMWSFVGSKDNKQWIWLSLDVDTREIVGAYIGSRDREGAEGLWNSLPTVYQHCAICYTDFWSAYEKVIPSDRHRAVGKESGKTSYIERFNCTMRQRISRLVRKTLSFSKKIENHIGAIWNFIHYYNSSLVLAVS